MLRVALLGSPAGRGYVISVTAAAPDGRVASVETSVVVALGPRPRVMARVEGSANAASGAYVVDAAGPLALHADVDWGAGGLGDVAWSVDDSSLDLGGVHTVPPWGGGSAKLALRAGALRPGGRYVFTATARAPGPAEGAPP